MSRFYAPYNYPISPPALPNPFEESPCHNLCCNFNGWCTNPDAILQDQRNFNRFIKICEPINNINVPYDGSYPDPCVNLRFSVHNLVANYPNLARNFDINLLNPWGIVVVNDIVWVANNGAGVITSYNLLGLPLISIINVFGAADNVACPTGIVHNPTNGFIVMSGRLSGPSTFLIATMDGTINGYNITVDPDNSYVVVDSSTNNSVYTGLTIAENCLYVADFYNKKIDTFDLNFTKITNYCFVDECTTDPIPYDYAPFNIVYLCGVLFVLYAKQNPKDNQYEFAGPGNGYISIFTLKGIFIKRFASRGVLDTPWGMVRAPSWFGFPAGAVMVANTGDGIINVFKDDGKFIGRLKDCSFSDICIDGVRGLAHSATCNGIIYWTADSNNMRNSFMGTINSNNSGI